ncbi:Methyltransferase type 11 [Kribbella flavida DSM 17836]|uniref:Methyltransferase type 11 n=1 Tax=Kribbella flavida (strain DSM 17836 / JCM 10339 / NBRC 14399) TaxID=479435 RepID=D2PV52_KRIFD|nr:class I SAM-dependent methyltransferase [Kribbella flavida]ADB33333.1 Methyltransferase type 11 [Kribbella flavida DSM 17836]
MASWSGYPEAKRRLIGSLSGEVLEIGAGTGANFAYLRDDVTWIGLEPNPRDRAALTRSGVGPAGKRRIIDGNAEQIPLPDASVDGALSTVVLCSVDDLTVVLTELRRVLRPGGRFVFFEHVGAAGGAWLRRLQRVAAPFTRRFDRGCDPTRDIETALRAAGFTSVDIEHFTMPGLLPIPFIAGSATR